MSKGTIATALAAACFAFAPTRVFAALVMPSTLMAQVDGTNWQVYFHIDAHPDAQSGDFKTVDVTTDNGRYGGHVNAPGVATTSGTFNSVNELISSLPNQWTITLDKGLATQRVYTTTLSTGSLATAKAPILTSPTHLQTVPDLRPTFEFSLPSYGDRPYNLTLYSDSDNAYVVQTTIAPGDTSWRVPMDLAPGHTYLWDLYLQNIFPGFQFSPAVDVNNRVLGGFGGGGNLTVERSILFSTPVPEPASLGLLVPAAWMLARRRAKR